MPVKHGQCSWHGLQGDSLALAVCNAVKQSSDLVVVVSANMQIAEQLRDQFMFFDSGNRTSASIFPDWETLPYDNFSPHQDIVSERLSTLYRLPQLKQGLLVVAAPTLMQRLPPADFVTRNSLVMNTGERLVLDDMRTRLDAAGYRCVSQVMEHGEFAIRGALLDLYPMGSRLPCRIDLFDDEIESIKTFNPEDQRSLEQLDAVRILPAREFPFDEASIKLFRQRFRAEFEGDPQASPVYRDVSNAIAPAGIEYYFPLFLDQTATLFDYLPNACTVIQLDGTESAFDAFERQASERYEARRHDHERPLLDPARLFINAGECIEQLAHRPGIQVSPFKDAAATTDAGHFGTRLPANVRLRPRTDHPAEALQRYIEEFHGRILITAESIGRRETLQDQLRGFGLRTTTVTDWQAFIKADKALGIAVAPLEQGFVIE
ncbi:MAG: transcription-repair coupling factor, partial [Gammaproteobacteria bacterium]|nr:transcription-repair coupling factor [Gammaproteobacteria bacterium]